jgi:hypothetical protein
MFVEFDSALNVLKFDGTGVSLHCHHYNCGLVKALEDMEGIDERSIIIQAAREEFHENRENIQIVILDTIMPK